MRLSGRARLATAIASVSLLVIAGVVLLGMGLWAEAAPADQPVITRLLRSQVALLASGGLLLLGLAALLLVGLLGRHVRAPRRLAADIRLIAEANPAHRLEVSGPADLAELAAAVNQLAERFEAAEREVAQRVEAGRADIAMERNRLAALMSELAMAVLVCNAEGRILLYNAAARRLLEDRPEQTGVVGLGRSVFGVVDRDLVTHVLDRSRAGVPVHATTAWGERILRVNVAPVVAAGGVATGGVATGGGVAGVATGGGAASGVATGFIVLAEDMTRRWETIRQRDALLRGLTESVRGAAGAVRGAIESLLEYPDMPADQRSRFVRIIGDEAVALSARVDELTRGSADHLTDRSLHEDMSAADLLTAVTSAVETDGGPKITIATTDAGMWLTLDGYAAVRAITALLVRLRTVHGLDQINVELIPSGRGRYAELTVRWQGDPVDTPMLRTWIAERTAGIGPDTIADVLAAHDAEVWSQSENGGSAYLRLLLPIADEPAEPAASPTPPARTATIGLDAAIDPDAVVVPNVMGLESSQPRPEFYDFDLFQSRLGDIAWDQRRLDEIVYTVFDTETTGLQPAAGDEIIAIGAVRVINGRLLRQETFDRLIDPRRSVSMASQRIHGLTPDVLRGQPTIDEVLPAFARFAEDTVLVGHNVSFDLAFLRLKEAQAGVTFTQPVLDTLLLSALIHPDHDEHTMEAIAARLGVDVKGRHSALGDALLTAHLFTRMLPLLLGQGIHTVGQAREAARRTYHARVDKAQWGGVDRP
jgi:DNA polymerase-3 subunit epsilon